MAELEYPWFEVVSGINLQQGDILKTCPVIFPPTDVLDKDELVVELKEIDVIVMTQSCDIENNKISAVLLCPIWGLSELKDEQLGTKRNKEKARQGQFPSIHMLNECSIDEHQQEFQIVDFKNIYTLPIDVTRKHAESLGERIRLLPPYREHLSQAFARYFMRVGLPSDIPKFS